MATLDSLIPLATENSTKKIAEQVIRLKRVRISLNKILDSFNKDSTRSTAPQAVHIQAIEDILYHDPHLFDDALIEKFFSIKNELDSGVINLPFSEERHKELFSKILQHVTKKIAQLDRRVTIINCCVYGVIIVVFVAAMIIGAEKVKSSWVKLFSCSAEKMQEPVPNK
jgi:hypothetical protein